jgi:hypothetical protein
MFSLLLKKALPFALTFVVGTALGGFAGLFGGSGKKAEMVFVTRTYDSHGRCGAHRQKLVAETVPLVIHSTPEVWLPRGSGWEKDNEPAAVVRVTFGADGKVQDVRPLTSLFRVRDENLVDVKVAWESVEDAARRIQFTPEIVNSVPVTVTRDIEMRFRTY